MVIILGMPVGSFHIPKCRTYIRFFIFIPAPGPLFLIRSALIKFTSHANSQRIVGLMRTQSAKVVLQNVIKFERST